MKEILLEKIKPNSHQPRKYFNKEAQEVLKETLKKQILPILVISGITSDIPKDVKIKEDEYLIIDGERRWRASKELKAKTMMCEVLDGSYTEAYDNAGIIHRTTATHDPQARAVLIVESILNHLGDELGKYGWSKDKKGVVSCAIYLQNMKKRGNAKNIDGEFPIIFTEISKRHGWEIDSVVRRLREDLNIPDDLLETIQDGTMAHTTATEFIKVKDKEIREKVIRKIKEKPVARREAQKMVMILVDKEAPQEIKERVLDIEEDVNLDFEKEKIQAIKQIKKDDVFTEGEKQEIEKKIIREEFEKPMNIVAKEKFKKAKKPMELQGVSPYEFVISLSVQLGKTVGNFKLLEPVWEYISESQRKGLEIHILELLKLWNRLNLINKEVLDEEHQKKKKGKILEIAGS